MKTLTSISMYYLIAVILFSCKKEYAHKIEFNIWKDSVEKVIKNESSLMDYEKENLNYLVGKVSEESFNKLTESLTSPNSISNDYLVLISSEGEVVSCMLFYIQRNNNDYDISVIDLYEENSEVKENINIKNYDVKKLISIENIDVNYNHNDVKILTRINKNEVGTSIGTSVF